MTRIGGLLLSMDIQYFVSMPTGATGCLQQLSLQDDSLTKQLLNALLEPSLVTTWWLARQ